MMITYDYFNPMPWGSHKQIIDLIGTNNFVLDLGCSTGRLSEAIKNKGNIVYGVELNPYNAEKAKSVCNKVFIGSIESIEQFSLKNDSFDVIILADVLEHLSNPESTLKSIRKFLKKDGFIIVSLPNVAHIYVRIKLLLGKFDYGPVGILDKTHLKFFTYKSALNLLIDSGYAIEDVRITIPNYPRSLALNANFFKIYTIFFHMANYWKQGLAFQFIFKVTKSNGCDSAFNEIQDDNME